MYKKISCNLDLEISIIEFYSHLFTEYFLLVKTSREMSIKESLIYSMLFFFLRKYSLFNI